MGKPKKISNCQACDINIENIRKKNLIFERKVSYAGRSRIITIPEDLARFMHLERGHMVKLIPVNHHSFLVEAVR